MILEDIYNLSTRDISQSHSWGDLLVEPVRKNYQAFCQNRHKARIRYKIPNFGTGYMVTGVGRNESSCPKCGYSLYWSSRYVYHKNQPDDEVMNEHGNLSRTFRKRGRKPKAAASNREDQSAAI